MGKFKSIKIGFIFLVITILLIGCASSTKGSYDKAEMDGARADYDVVQEETSATRDSGYIQDNASVNANNSTILNSQDKIIRHVNMDIETKDFDLLINSIDTQINELGGYVEKSSISGRHYESDNLRYGTIVARVPKESVDGFIFNLGEIANVVNKEESIENITLQYVDVESHIKALEIEQERLLALLEKAEKLEDIVTLEARLTSVRYELQGYESTLRTFDNQVDYSTINMYIQEVRLMSSGIDEEKTVWTRIETGLSESIYNIGEGLKNFFVWFIVNLPYLLIWAVVIIIILIIVKKQLGKRNLKDALKNINTDDIKIPYNEDEKERK